MCFFNPKSDFVICIFNMCSSNKGENELNPPKYIFLYLKFFFFIFYCVPFLLNHFKFNLKYFPQKKKKRVFFIVPVNFHDDWKRGTICHFCLSATSPPFPVWLTLSLGWYRKCSDTNTFPKTEHRSAYCTQDTPLLVRQSFWVIKCHPNHSYTHTHTFPEKVSFFSNKVKTPILD